MVHAEPYLLYTYLNSIGLYCKNSKILINEIKYIYGKIESGYCSYKGYTKSAKKYPVRKQRIYACIHYREKYIQQIR